MVVPAIGKTTMLLNMREAGDSIRLDGGCGL
jgi:hypothetical protein